MLLPKETYQQSVEDKKPPAKDNIQNIKPLLRQGVRSIGICLFPLL